MAMFDAIREFTLKSYHMTSIGELASSLDSLAPELGFDYFALVHHVDPKAPPVGAVQFWNYPNSWVERIMERDYFSDDPIHAACQKTVAGFKWSDVSRFIDVSDRHHEIFDQAKKEGLGDGFSVPVHTPGDFSGSCSFGVKTGRLMDERSFTSAQSLGLFAFEAAREIQRRNMAADGLLPLQNRKLTTRQLDCVALVGRGKTDWEIGRILGISEFTAHNHVEAAKKKYGVTSRQQLVLRALHRGELTFGDVLTGHPV